MLSGNTACFVRLAVRSGVILPALFIIMRWSKVSLPCYVTCSAGTTSFYMVVLCVDNVTDHVRVMILPARPTSELLPEDSLMSDLDTSPSFNMGVTLGKVGKTDTVTSRKKKKVLKPPKEQTVQSWKDTYSWLNILPLRSEDGFPIGQCKVCTQHSDETDPSPFRTVEGCVLRDVEKIKVHNESSR